MASKEFVKDNPAKRLGDPKEVGRLVAFLLSGESPFINGAIIPIDGAQSAKY
ncbi:SDR family oxidoreductase [Paenibacillus polysaccharolyticus]|uniref:SDR family oxidoreductase n=1 Tax=Paenibacillus polysaccharolyticus TaxID=582692 RepID=UPI0030B8E55B